MNRSFRHRVGALAAVLLAGAVMLAWPSPAAAATGSRAQFDNVVASCPTVPSYQNIQGPVTRTGTSGNPVIADQIQCAVTTESVSAQVTGKYSGGTFDLKCLIHDGQVSTIKRVGSETNELTGPNPYAGGPVTVSAIVDGILVSVTCEGPAAAPTTTTTAAYPLAVDVGGASGADSALASSPTASAESSGSGTPWLFVAGVAALLVVGQIAIGRRRRNAATD